MREKKFQKNIENFSCEHCGEKVEGTGYTNHCPRCLWSKHVDINPGDRASECNGMMEPVSIEIIKNKYSVTCRCQKCGFTKKNKTSGNDNMDEIIKLSSKDNIKNHFFLPR